jgi:hypothetical protein
MKKFLRIVNDRVGHDSTETAPRTMDKSQTPTSYVQLPVRGTTVSRGIGGRRETGACAISPTRNL